MSAEDLKALAEIAKVRQSAIPWYERSISTLGIIAFFSMLIATSVQTINSAKAEIESSNLRQEIKGLESQRQSWNKIIKELSEVVVLKQSSSGRLEKSEEDVLKQRLAQLLEIERPGKEDIAEKLRIFLALKQYDGASALLQKSPALADEASPENLIFYAEISFIDGAKGQTRALLKRFESQMSKQPIEWQLRYFVINAALSSDPKSFAKDVAALKQLELNEAEELLTSRVLVLKEQAMKYRNSTLRGTPEE
jgi:hypothetical protein